MSKHKPEDYPVRKFCPICGKQVIAERVHHYDYGVTFEFDEVEWYYVDVCSECNNEIED